MGSNTMSFKSYLNTEEGTCTSVPVKQPALTLFFSLFFFKPKLTEVDLLGLEKSACLVYFYLLL